MSINGTPKSMRDEQSAKVNALLCTLANYIEHCPGITSMDRETLLYQVDVLMEVAVEKMGDIED